MSKTPDQTTDEVAQLSYQEAVDQLEQIVTSLDEGTVDVDTLSEQFQRAIDIVEELDSRISRAKTKVNQLVPRLEAIGNASPSEGTEERF